MKRVLITGAAGFFGAHAMRSFDPAQWEVHGLDRPGVDRERFDAITREAKLHEVDLLDPNAVRVLVNEVKPDLAVHLAWYVVPGKFWAAPENIDHLNASFGLCRALVDVGCKRIVTAGTCFEYDVATATAPLTEDSPTRPTLLYSATKLAMFEVLRQAAKGWGISYAHLRFFYQYGRYEGPNRLVSDVMWSLVRSEEAKVTTGEQVRDFLDIEDVASAIAIAGASDAEGAINVGSGIPVTVRDVVSAAARAYGKEYLVRYGARPSRPDDPAFIVADVTRLRSLGWSPKVDLESGMQALSAFYRPWEAYG